MSKANLCSVGFIGCGNMGGALARAALGAALPGETAPRFLFADPDAARASSLCAAAAAVGVTGEAVRTEELARAADVIFLGVKPQSLPGLAEEIAPLFAARQQKPLLISMAAGQPIARIVSLFGDSPVIRIMPNLPASVGEGMILYTPGEGVSEEQLSLFRALLAPAGLTEQLPEGQIDAASAVSGCGPAFAALFVEALADGGVLCGLPRALALRCAEQTVKGTAAQLLDGGTHPAVLKDAVCSPGGTTVEGVRALEAGGFRAAAIEAVCAAYRRTLELGKK